VGLGYVIKDHYVSIRRAQHRMSHASSIMAIGTAVEVGGSAVGGALWGLNGLSRLGDLYILRGAVPTLTGAACLSSDPRNRFRCRQ